MRSSHPDVRDLREPPHRAGGRTAIRRKHGDLVLLLLCSGYRLELEAEHWNSVLDEALEAGALDILELLLKWGAEPTKVRTENVVAWGRHRRRAKERKQAGTPSVEE